MSRDIKIETSMKVSTIMAQAPENCVPVAANKSPYEKSADIRCDIRGFFKYADYRLNFPFLHLAAA